MFAKISTIGIWPILRPWACIYVCIYFVIIRPPPKEGRTATLCSRLILYLSFLSSAGLALLENFSSEQDRNAFAPPLQDHWLSLAAKPRPLGYIIQWGRGIPHILSVLRERIKDGDIMCRLYTVFLSFNGGIMSYPIKPYINGKLYFKISEYV